MNGNGNKGAGYVRSHLRASSIGSGEGRGKSRRLLFAVACLAMLATLAIGLSVASAAAPVVTMGTVTNPGYTTAQGTGEINAEGGGYYAFEASTDGTNWESKSYAEISGSNPHSASSTIGELKPETHYFIRLKFYSYNDGSETFSPPPYAEITTLGPVPKPTVPQVAVAGFTGTTAHFSGKINPGAASTDPALTVRWHFVCEPACLELSHGSDEFVDDGVEHTVDTDAEIDPNTDYTIKLVAENMGGSNSAQTSFHSASTAPVVKTLGGFPFGTSGTEAMIGGEVNPRNLPTEYWLEYGPGAGGPGATYPSAIPSTKDAVVPQVSGTGNLEAGSNRITNVTATSGTFNVGQLVTGPGIPPLTRITGLWPNNELRVNNGVAENVTGATLHATGPQVFTQTLTGLEAGATYHYRIVAKNSTGTTEGTDVSFQTLRPSSGLPSSCPNEKLRNETHSEALGDCRAYEMTTPGDKNGGDANLPGDVSPDGNSVGYYSPSAFSEPKANAAFSTYISQRTPTGWVNHSMDPKAAVPSLGEGGAHMFSDISRNFKSAVGFNGSSALSEPQAFNAFLVGVDGSETWVTSPTLPSVSIQDKVYVGQSADGSHILFQSSQPFENGVSGEQLWEWVNGKVSLVSEVPGPGGEEPAGGQLGSGANYGPVLYAQFQGGFPDATAVSEDGERIFFSSRGKVWVREEGTHTREVDLSQRAGSVGEPPEAGSGYVDAAIDGSIVFFNNSSQLTNDAPVGGGLYAFNLDTDHLSLVTKTFEGKPLVSHDGSHVYFASSSVLVPGEGVKGRHNLYEATLDGNVHYIATLADDDSADWAPDVIFTRPMQTTPDGKVVIFLSYERLTAYDNAGHGEVYRYDATDEELSCVSCGIHAAPAKGDAGITTPSYVRGGSLAVQIGRYPVIGSDGNSVLFQSTEALLPADVNGLTDVYLFQDGHLSLVSTGSSKFASEVAGLSADGSNALFITRDSLVGQDLDGGNIDIYDARVDGGFPAPTSSSICESESACQGTPSAPPTFTTPPTTSAGRGNPKPEKKACKKAKKAKGKCGSKKPKKKHKTKKHHKSGATKTGRGK